MSAIEEAAMEWWTVARFLDYSLPGPRPGEPEDVLRLRHPVVTPGAEVPLIEMFLRKP
jgi:hypothetical protein